MEHIHSFWTSGREYFRYFLPVWPDFASSKQEWGRAREHSYTESWRQLYL